MFSLMIGAMFPIIHLGRPWLFFWLAPYPSAREIWPNFRSPLVWDFFAINTYLTGSLLFLLLPMIPDFALVRDRSTGLRRRIYGALALGWRGTTKQWHRLEAAMQIMAIAIIPVAVSVHTIVSFDFSMAPVPMWHSTIFGPYFVAGAIFSGIAALIIAMASLRKVLKLEDYLHPLHFENLGKLLLLMSLLWVYFVFSERLTVWYGNEPSEMAVFWATQRGEYAPLFWTMVICNFVIPFPILSLRRLRTIPGMRRRVVRRVDRDVARALPDHRAVARAQGAAVQLGHLLARSRSRSSSCARRSRAMGLLYTLFAKFVPDHLDLGDEGGRPSASEGHAAGRGRGAGALEGPAVTAIYGLYADPDTAQLAVEQRARRRHRRSRDHRHLRRSLSRSTSSAIATRRPGSTGSPAVAASLGLAAAYLLTSLTQQAWPINTGGMPIVSPYPNAIVIFEMTMLGAILATVITLFITAKLPNRGPRLYDPEVSDGYILVGIEQPPAARLDALRSALDAGGKGRVRTTP